MCADRMRNYFMYENKRRNKFLIEYPKIFATDRHCVCLRPNVRPRPNVKGAIQINVITWSDF